MNTTHQYIAEAFSEYYVSLNRDYLKDIITDYQTTEDANEGLRCLTGIRNFFPNSEAFGDFKHLLTLPTPPYTKDLKAREWGDFQTPPELALQVCRHLEQTGVSPQVIVEPTYGAGHFIIAALRVFSKAQLVYGVEIQDKYEWHLKMCLLTDILCGNRPSTEIELNQDDIFGMVQDRLTNCPTGRSCETIGKGDPRDTRSDRWANGETICPLRGGRSWDWRWSRHIGLGGK